MTLISFDLETHPFGPGNMAPKIVCMSWYDGEKSDLVGRDEIHDIVLGWLQDPEITLCGWYVAFDAACLSSNFPDLMPLIFAKYGDGGILCGKAINKLYDLATVGEDYQADQPYTLETAAWRWVKKRLEKDKYRLDYGDWDGIPIAQWEQGRRDYAINDSIFARDVIITLLTRIKNEQVRFEWDEWARQSKRDLWINCMTCQGWYTDPVYVDQLESHAKERQGAVRDLLVPLGILEERLTGRKPCKVRTGQYVAKYKALLGYCVEKGYVRLCDGKVELGGPIPSTPTGKLSLDKKALKRINDPILDAVVLWKRLAKDITEATFMRAGVHEPIHFRYDSLKDTGRTSAGRIQNRERAFGYRECFIPGKDEVICSVDYEGNESRTLGQVLKHLFGESKFADDLNAGRDVLTAYACICHGWDYDETVKRKKEPDVKRARQDAKAPIYGFPGMMGEHKFIDYGRDVWGVTIPPTKLSTVPMEGYVELPTQKHWDATVLLRALPSDVLAAAYDDADNAVWDPGQGQEFIRVYCRWLFGRYAQLYCLKGSFQWLKAMWYEMDPSFLKYRNAIRDEIKECGGITQYGSGRFRAAVSLPEGANSKFQGLAGDGGAEAGWLLAIAQFVDPSSPLYGTTRTAAFIHDEFLFKIKIDAIQTAPWECARIMCKGMDVYTPDVPSRAEPALMRRWTKQAETSFDLDKNLVPWEDYRLMRGIDEDIAKDPSEENLKRLVDEKKDLLSFFARHQLSVVGRWE